LRRWIAVISTGVMSSVAEDGVLDGRAELIEGRAAIRRSGRGRTSQLPVEQMRSLAADVFHILDGKVVRLMHYPDRDHALSDLGLTPEDDSPGDREGSQ
jgi:ketosteroid isomerase-like protein